MAYRHWIEDEAEARGLKTGSLAEMTALAGNNLVELGKMFWTIVRDWRAISIVIIGGIIMIGAADNSPSARAMAGVGGDSGNTLQALSIQIDQPVNFDSLPNPDVTELTNGSQEQDNAARIQRIQMAAAILEANPDLWANAPELCRESMVKVGIYGSGEASNGGSGSLIQSDELTDAYGNVYMVHHILLADHIMRGENGELLDGRAVVYPGNYNQDQRFAFNIVNYKQLVDDDGTLLDEGILTIYGQGSWGNMSDVGTIPLGVGNVRGFDAVNTSGILYSLDYPGVTDAPQFTVSTMGGTYVDSIGDATQLMDPLDGSSTVWPQSSGGAMCNINSEHRGVVKNIPPNEPAAFGIEENPMNIQGQIINAIYGARENLELMYGSLIAPYIIPRGF